MIPIYRACNAEYGPGMRDRMFAIMEDNMHQRPIFSHIRTRALDYMQTPANTMWEASSSKLETIRQDIEAQCRRVDLASTLVTLADSLAVASGVHILLPLYRS